MRRGSPASHARLAAGIWADGLTGTDGGGEPKQGEVALQ